MRKKKKKENVLTFDVANSQTLQNKLGIYSHMYTYFLGKKEEWMGVQYYEGLKIFIFKLADALHIYGAEWGDRAVKWVIKNTKNT